MLTDPLLSTAKRRWLGRLTTALFTIALLGAFLWPNLTRAAHLVAPSPDPVTGAWQKAKAAGSYHFTSDVLQKTLPVASLTNVGRTSHTDAFHLEGQNDLRNQTLEMTLWNQGGSVRNAASGVSVRTEKGKSFTRRGTEPWQATDNQTDAFAPQGDFLGYLAAIRNVRAGVHETRNAISFTRYTFELDGPTFANYIHAQLTAAMRAKGELPAGVQLDPPAYYRNMTGSGELWVGTNGLPLRQILNLRFPEQNEERVEANMTVDFAKYGAEQTSLLTLLSTGQWQGAWLVLPQRLPDFTPLWLALVVSGLAVVVLVYRQRRTVYIAIVVAVIFAEVAGPLLNTLTQVRFFAAYRAKAAAQAEQQAVDQSQRELQTKVTAAPAFNPHQNPRLNAELGARNAELAARTQVQNLEAVTVRQNSTLNTPQSALVDPGTDTDHDGLTDFTEVRIGTSEVISDTDDDGLPDNLEVNGFTLGGQTWYTNPNVTDSNNDGLSDIVEWGIDSNTGLPQATPRDTDGDGLPDLFDPDNDNDGVPDRVDTAPFAKGAVTYTEAAPLQFSVNNLAANKPTFVDFQIRPQDPKNLWFAYNVLDWPQDSDGQMRDVDNSTYATVATAAGRTADVSDANGDMKLVPMLEIRIPITSANLPSQAELPPFNISVNDFTTDGQTKVAYVPLTIVTDQLTGERVAFSGQMRYKSTGSWTVPHSVRLAWVVQALNDLPCDPQAADAAAQGCQSDGYIHNQPIMLHTYYANWTLTGLGVREENGASVAVLYEDPAVDPNKKDDAPLWALTTALDQHFLAGHDANNDGVRDLRLNDFPARFDRDNNPADAQRFSIPNIMQVVTNTYTTGDEAAMATAMTTTVNILNNAFKPSVQADNAIKPLLLFAEENNLRAVGLDQVVAGEGYATQNGANVSFNLAPTPTSALPVVVNANLKWMAYCGANGNNVTWRPCTSDEYAGIIESRYANAPSLPDDTDLAETPGRMMLALSYYFTLAGGYQAQVQEGPRIASSRYQLEGESETATRLRLGFSSVAPLPQIVLQSLIHLLVAISPHGLNSRTPIIQQIKTTVIQLGETHAKLQKNLANLAMQSENPVVLTKQEIRALKVPFSTKMPTHFARFAAAAVVGSAIMLLTTVLSQNPDFNVPTRAVLGAIGAAVTIGVTIYLPAATASGLYKFNLDKLAENAKAPKPSLSKILTNSLVKSANMRTAFVAGLVVNVALIWGFFAYAAGTSGLAAGSPELNKAAAEAIASTVVAVLMAVLSVTFIGTIIAGIISVIDLILNLICELGVDQLRIQGSVYGGACFSITTTATKVLAYFLYNYEPMIDTSRNDLMVAGAPHVTVADPNKGYVPSNTLTLNLPVTTTVVHKSPDPSAGVLINGYLWLYSPDNLRSSTFQYGLTQGAPASLPVDLNQMNGAWQDVREDHKYVLTPMYRGVATTNPAPLNGLKLTQGINSTVPFSLTMSFAIPAYECWLIPIPYGPIIIPTPICRTREFENANTMPFTMLKYDVLPNTLAEFLTLGAKANGGGGQSWDARFPSLRDADGDGLTGPLYQGLDPNDTTWDTDGDGLSDRFELEQRTAGAGYAPLLRDTDGDGLTDKQEMELGTDPAVADTDNDGLSDGVEVRHQVYAANGKLTSTWAGGWQVTINSTPPRTIWVSSDPFNADSDQDGVSDQAEKELAANANPALRLDSQGVPYNPNVPNTAPLAVFTQSDAFNGYVRPGQSFGYTTTVVANVPVVPGVLNITPASVLTSAPNPLALAFSSSPTVTRAISLTVKNGVASQNFALGSTVNTRLPDTGAAKWLWSAATTPAGLGVFAGRLARRIAATPLPNRPDMYRLAALASTSPGSGSTAGPGDIWSYTLPLNTARSLATDGAGATTTRGVTSPDVACNLSGVCLTVWEERPSGGLNSDLRGVLIQPDGTVNSATFTIVSSTADTSGNSNAKVASDGVNFLVAWQRLFGVYVPTPSGNTYNFQTNLMTRLYNGQGVALTPVTELANEKVEATSLNTPTLGDLNASRYHHNQLALTWIGDRYRLLRWFDLGAASTAQDVSFKENGVNASRQSVTWRDIDASGALVPGSKLQIYTQNTLDDRAGHSMFYDPKSNFVIVAHSDSGEAKFQMYQPPATTISGLLPLASNAANVVAAYYAQTSSYLFGWTDTSTAARPFTYKAYDSSTLDTLSSPSPQQLTWSVPVSAIVGTALACSAAASVPQIDLRFEELPGATTFTDSSGFGHNATCTGATCPAPGVTGAPNAPLSDYALRFDGVDDRLSINTALANSFTAALWMKSAPNANNDTLLVEQSVQTPNGWTFYLGAGAIHLLIGTNQFLDSFSPRVDDNQWHFVAATRNGSTGATALYVDGVQIKTGTATTSALTALNTLMIGGDRVGKRSFNGLLDHLQLFPVALDASTIQAIYNRSFQAPCIAAGVALDGTTFPWSSIQVQPQDTRGGRISASGGLTLTVDSTPPTATVTSVTNNQVLGPDQVIGGAANDQGVGVGKVEVSINNGAWQLANGANTWTYSLAGLTGAVGLRVRATDLVGNVGNPSTAVNVTIDNTPPQITINAPASTLKPTKTAGGQWQVPLTGAVTDDKGLKTDALWVKLTQASGVGVAQSQQAATVTGNTWSLNYLLDPSLFDPTGSYTVTAQVDDNVGNRTRAAQVVRLDATGPVAALNPSDATRAIITQTVTLGGVVSDTNSLVGLDKLEIAFTPVDQIAALPGNISTTQADAQLNRTWLPVTLAQRGAGVATTTWRFAIPLGLENVYQIDLRGTDLLGNVSLSANLWRGLIDTSDPRVAISATATGASYFATGSQQTLYEVRFVCAAVDRNLREDSFTCPGNALQPPVRSFTNYPSLQALFPDLTIRSGLANTYTLWSPTTTHAATVRACDGFGRCAQTSPGSVNAAARAELGEAAAAPGAPVAVVINPTNDSFVAAGSTLTVTVAAEAGALLKTVTLSLDNQVVQTLDFAQTDNVTRTLRTLGVGNVSEGQHTLVAQATAWDATSQTTLYPVTFTVDQHAPLLTIDPNTLTLADTWQPASGVLRFKGNASDSVGLVAVQIREGNNSFADAAFANGAWHVALPVTDPEGRTLTITVRAIDRAGRSTEVTQQLATDLSAPDAPDTTLNSGPAELTPLNSAQFGFTGSATAVAFACSLDNGGYAPCASPTNYSDLSKGPHTFRVRAIDSRGLVDLSPATLTWTVSAGQVDAVITAQPAHSTTERTASFSFNGSTAVARFECSLDGGAYSPCTSPASFNDLGYGEHTFRVRAVNSTNEAGAAAAYTWTVLNLVPVAHDLSVTVPHNQTTAVTLTADDNEPLVYTIVTPPAHGVLSGLAPALSYTPATNYSGPDSFTFKASDGRAESNVATVALTVAQAAGDPQEQPLRLYLPVVTNTR